MSELKITTNNQPRDMLSWLDLTDKEKKEFDFDGMEDTSYFRYKGWCYCLADFMCISDNSPKAMQSWQGYHSDSFFSGIVIKFADKYCEQIIVGRFVS